MPRQRERLVPWELHEAVGKTPSFGDFTIESPDVGTLTLALPYEEGELRVRFNDVRSFVTIWDGDPDFCVSARPGTSRPSDLVKVEGSFWLTDFFSLDIVNHRSSAKAWEHFWIVASERSIHIAARDDIDAQFIEGTWSGGPGAWHFTPVA